jgi:hypothetical protein
VVVLAVVPAAAQAVLAKHLVWKKGLMHFVVKRGKTRYLARHRVHQGAVMIVEKARCVLPECLAVKDLEGLSETHAKYVLIQPGKEQEHGSILKLKSTALPPQLHVATLIMAYS